MSSNTEALKWYRVADLDELPNGRVKTVTADTHSMALTHIDTCVFSSEWINPSNAKWETP